MEIVPTSTHKKKEIGLEDLIQRKTELKKQIQDQKLLVSTSAQKLFSPASVSSYIFGSFKKSLNLVDGIMIGFKVVRSIRRLIHRFR